jgi:hypothetical protein
VSSTDNITNDDTPSFDLTSTDAYYRFERGGVQISTDYGSNATFTDSHRPDGPYTYALRAVDAAGNVSAPSAPLNISIDTIAPAAPTPAGSGRLERLGRLHK